MWYQQQPSTSRSTCTHSCDLLKNIYLCGINNNQLRPLLHPAEVVICLKISTFVVSTTTQEARVNVEQCCDLLKNIYLCGINNNSSPIVSMKFLVVICLKISTFVVSTTTDKKVSMSEYRCDLLKNIYLCGINNNLCRAILFLWQVVICLKISTFVVSTTTKMAISHDTGLL